MSDLLLDDWQGHFPIYYIMYDMAVPKGMYDKHFQTSSQTVVAVCPLQVCFIHIRLKYLADTILCV